MAKTIKNMSKKEKEEYFSKCLETKKGRIALAKKMVPAIRRYLEFKACSIPTNSNYQGE